MATVNLNEILLAYLDSARSTMKDSMLYSLNMSSNLWVVQLEPAAVDSVLSSLLQLARNELPKSGQITLETVNLTIDSDESNMEVGDYARLSVSNTPKNSASNSDNRLSESDSKAIAGISALSIQNGKNKDSLESVCGIAEQAGGYLCVYTEPGQGKTFQLYLPRYLPEDMLVHSVEPMLST